MLKYKLMEAIRWADLEEISKILTESSWVAEERIYQDGANLLHFLLLQSHSTKTLIDILNILLKSDIDLNAATFRDSITPLYMALRDGQIEIAEILISNGANINQIDYFGNSLLHIATMNNNTNLVRLLLDYGASPEIVNENGQYAYTIANDYHYIEIMNIIIEYHGYAANRWIEEDYFIERRDIVGDISPNMLLGAVSSIYP